MKRCYDARTRNILADPEKRHAWVMNALRLKGLTLADVARDGGVHRVALYHVWQKRYPRMQSLLAAALDMRPQDLFPERYDADGLPLKWGAPDGKHTTRPKRSNGRSTEKKQPGIKESQAA